jgi:hypothetical protein
MTGLRIATLDEELELVRGLNRSTGRRVGIYPEIKEPAWHARHGIDLARLLLRKLDEHGYRTADDPVFVQCFDEAELQRVRSVHRSKLNLVQLVGRDSTGAELLTPAGMRRTAAIAQGLGPHYSQLVVPPSDAAPAAIEPSPVVAHAMPPVCSCIPTRFGAMICRRMRRASSAWSSGSSIVWAWTACFAITPTSPFRLAIERGPGAAVDRPSHVPPAQSRRVLRNKRNLT